MSLTINPLSITFTRPALTVVPLSITFGASTPATGFGLAGPSSGTVGVASSNFTYTPNGNYTGTITPAMAGLAGSWSPSVLTWTGDAAAKTAAFTSAAAGSGTANGTPSPSLTRPSGVAFAAAAIPATVAYYCSIDGVPSGTSTPTLVLKDAAGNVVTPATGGTAVSVGSGAYSFPFTAPAGLYLGVITAGGVVVVDTPRTLAASGGGGGSVVLPNSSVTLDAGTVSDTPAPPTTSSFWAAAVGNPAPSTGAYNGMAIRTTTVGKPVVRRGIVAHTAANGQSYFVLGGSPLPAPPAAGDTFVIE
jgi:hypothetical protein